MQARTAGEGRERLFHGPDVAALQHADPREGAFAPIDPTNVRMYACGPTVYDSAHIGNARPIIVFDLLFRLLRHLYGAAHVTYARNVTDVDDKINARAAERGITIRELTDGTLGAFHDDIRELGVLMPEDVNVAGERPRFVEPRATDHIAEMRAIIERLVASRPRLRGGRTTSCSTCRRCRITARSRSGRSTRWRPARASRSRPTSARPSTSCCGSPRSPASRPGPRPAASRSRAGRAGTSSARRCRGSISARPSTSMPAASTSSSPTTRTRSRSRAAASARRVMANVWLHNGFLQVEGEKMSKSLGNFVTIRDVLKDWPGEVVRLAMLKTHYRQPIDWTLRGLEEASRMLERWYGLVGDVGPRPVRYPPPCWSRCWTTSTPLRRSPNSTASTIRRP